MPKMSEAKIVKKISLRSCMIKFKERGDKEHKRHYQMRRWRNIDTESDSRTSKGDNEKDGVSPVALRKSTRLKQNVKRHESNDYL